MHNKSCAYITPYIYTQTAWLSHSMGLTCTVSK